MHREDVVISDVQEVLDKHGYTLLQYLNALGRKNAPVLNLCEDAYEKFAQLYQRLSEGDYNAGEKGKLLEALVDSLFRDGYGFLFDTHSNWRTSTNEIDVLLFWTEKARLIGLPSAYSFLGNSILCECKNYKKPVDVTYVGKFASLLHTSDVKLGIMFAWDGVSGRGKWDAAQGLIKKIALRDRDYIIIIDRHDLRKIYEKQAHVFSLLYEKYEALKLDTDYEKYIVPHEANGKL